VPSYDECGLASWEPADVADLVLPAWDEFVEIAAQVDLGGPSRLAGWTARDVCVHLGSWPSSRTFERLLAEAERDDVGPDSATFDQDAHNDAVLAAHGDATRDEVLAALRAARDEAATYLSSADVTRLGRRPVRSVLGPLPLTTIAAAATYELAVHALDLAPAGAPAPSSTLLSSGMAALVDTTGALAARLDMTASAGCVSGDGGWGFAAVPGAWTTLELPALPGSWPAVQGRAADILDASAGRRTVPVMLARRELRLHQVAGLMALAPIVEAVPGLPGGAALSLAVRNLRGLGRLVRRLPGLPR
jgi:uncharacterized protein (TIGR03083 family)